MRIRALRTIAALLGVGAVLAAGACGGGAGGVSTDSGASLLRAGTFVFVSIDSDLESDQWQQVDDLLRKFPGRSKLIAELRRELAEDGVQYERDIEPALGPEVDVAVGDVSNFEDVPFALMTKPDDEDKFKALVRKLNKSEDTDDPAVYRKVGEWYVVSESQAMIDRLLKGEGASLRDDATFTAAMEEAPDDALVKAYVNGRELGSVFRRAMQQGGAGGGISNLGFDKLDFVVASLSAEDDGMRLEGSAKGESTDEFGAKPYTSKLVPSIPAGALAVASFKGSGTVKQWNELRENPFFQQGLREVERELGVSLDEVVGLLQNEIAFYVRRGAPLPEFTLMLEAPNEQRALATVDRLMMRVARLAGAEITSGEQGGVSVKSLDLQQVVVHYAAFDGMVVVTSGPSGIRDLRGDGDKLADDPVFNEARDAAGMPEQTAGFAYVNLKDGVPLVLGYAAADGGDIPADVRENLEPLRSFVTYGSTEGDVSSFTGFLEIE